jgi:hypothetical protein
MVFLKESLGAWAACFLCEGVNPLIWLKETGLGCICAICWRFLYRYI